MNDNQFLVDTSIWIRCLRETDQSLLTYISSLVIGKRAFTNELIIFEILRGAKSNKEYNILYEDFSALPQLALNHGVWETAWGIGYKLRKKGISVPMADTLIAASALHYNYALLHCDNHFNLIAKYTSLKTKEL